MQTHVQDCKCKQGHSAKPPNWATGVFGALVWSLTDRNREEFESFSFFCANPVPISFNPGGLGIMAQYGIITLLFPPIPLPSN